MKKTIVTLSTAAVLGLSSAGFVGTAHAEKSVSDIQHKRTEVKDNLSSAESKIADVLVDLDELNSKIANADDSLEKNKKQVTKTKHKISHEEKKVDKLKDEIDKLQDRIDKRYKIMKKRISSYQKSGGDVKYLQVVFSSKDFSDLINRSSAVSKISDADKDLMKQQQKDKEAVEKKEKKVKKKLDKLKDEKAEKEAIRDTIKEQKKKNKQDKEKLESKENDLQDMKSHLETKSSKLESLESEVRQNMKETNASHHDQPSTKATASTNSSSDSKTVTAKTENNVKPKTKSTKTNSKSPKKASNTSSSKGGGSALTAGNQFIGKSTYVFGAKNPSSGQFDCSGFVSWAYQQEGVSLPRQTDALAASGQNVSSSDMQPGDLVFFDTYKKNGHVGIYLGGGQFIGSQDSTGVAKASMSNPYWKKNFHGVVRRVK